jgi:hypothetical protein
MKTVKVLLGVASFAAVLFAFQVVIAPLVVLAQADAHIGTWVLNVAKSKHAPGPPPKDQTSVYSAAGQGLKVATKGTGADGKPTATEFTVTFDGKDSPVKGNPDYDATTAKRVDSNTIEFTRKRGGKVVQTATSVVSKDGKTRTVTATGVNAAGQKINNVSVYEKK